MRFSSLGSGSRGNAALVTEGETCILVDCGFSAIEMEKRMHRLGMHPSDLDAILVTHEHTDHISGVARLHRKFSTPVWMTSGTAESAAVSGLEEINYISGYTPFNIGSLRIKPFPVPHDAREPSQFVFDNGSRRLGFLTDVGSITDHIVDCLKECDALFLECNHDQQMLADSLYPQSLKDRVSGRLGHLNNTQAAELLSRLDTGRLQHLVAAHLSEKNNTQDIARTTLAGAMGCDQDWIIIADQDKGLEWRDLV